jgi:hypothetical protein
MMGTEYVYPPGIAIVEPGNPIGGAFTLPTGFIDVTGKYSRSWTNWWGVYSEVSYSDYYNGPGKFAPNHGSTASAVRMVFPTTRGNPIPNYGLGNPVTPTTTFEGRYDMSREWSIRVTPGPNRFGGTFRLFHGSNLAWNGYRFYSSQALYNSYGYYICLDDGMFDCTPDTFESEPGTTAIYEGIRWLLTANGKAKATTPTTPYGNAPTPYGNASYFKEMRRYLNLIHPWTTGYAWAFMRTGSGSVSPRASGYDTSLGGADITVTHYDWNFYFHKTLSTFITTTQTTKQYLKGVTRVVSLVRPRLISRYRAPLGPGDDSIYGLWTYARLWRLKVFFLPEPSGMLLLGAGLGCLVVLHRLRRRG